MIKQDKNQFNIDKRNILSKKDKSKKGTIDKPIIEMINFLNSLDDYYTTSSCSGRILILKIPASKRKDKVEWLLTKHSPVNIEEVKDALKRFTNNYNKGDELWFKQEPLIIHIAARSIEKAERLLDIAKLSGFKKSGVIALSRRFVVEIEGTDFLSTIIGINGKILVNDEYMESLIGIGNKKLLNNLKRKDKLFKNMKRELK